MVNLFSLRHLDKNQQTNLEHKVWLVAMGNSLKAEEW